MAEGARKEAGGLGAARRVRAPRLPDAAVVAEEGRVAEHVAATAHVHGVSEVPERGADHVHREVALEATLPLRARHQAFDSWQLSQTHGGRKSCVKSLLK